MIHPSMLIMYFWIELYHTRPLDIFVEGKFTIKIRQRAVRRELEVGTRKEGERDLQRGMELDVGKLGGREGDTRSRRGIV